MIDDDTGVSLEARVEVDYALGVRDDLARIWASELSHGWPAEQTRQSLVRLQERIRVAFPAVHEGLAWTWPIRDAALIHAPWLTGVTGCQACEPDDFPPDFWASAGPRAE